MEVIQLNKMTLVDKTFEQMQGEIGFEEFVTYDIVSIDKDPQLFEKYSDIDGFYPAEYYLLGVLAGLNVSESCYEDLEKIIPEVLLNAYERAHGCDGNLDMSIKTARGSDGSIIRIRDSGNGFNHQAKVKQLRRGKRYYKRGGGGFVALDKPGVEASYEGNGSILNIMVGGDED